MSLLPEWAPNLHPLVIHFPIALLCVAALLDVAGVLFSRLKGLRTTATLLFVLGAVSALAAYFSGQDAADTVALPPLAQPVLTTHADWAVYTVWFFGLYALIRLALHLMPKKINLAIPMMVLGLGGLFLVYETAEHGAQMVFEHGVGVQAATADATAEEDCEVDLDADFGADFDPDFDEASGSDAPPSMPGGPTMAANGTWTWAPDLSTLAHFTDHTTFLEGAASDLSLSLVADDAHPVALALTTTGTPAFFTAGDPFVSVQAEAVINADGFDGEVRLVHHVQDAQNYHFVALAKGQMQQGAVRDGVTEMMDEKAHAASGWITLKAVGDGTHFRGYDGDALVVHGHGTAPDPGPVGLRLDGQGTVRIALLSATSLR